MNYFLIFVLICCMFSSSCKYAVAETREFEGGSKILLNVLIKVVLCSFVLKIK